MVNPFKLVDALDEFDGSNVGFDGLIVELDELDVLDEIAEVSVDEFGVESVRLKEDPIRGVEFGCEFGCETGPKSIKLD